MRKKTPIIAIVILFLVPTLISNAGIVSAQTYSNTQATYTLTSNGTIQNESPNNTTNAATLILQTKNGYYEVLNGATQQPIIGGPDNLAGVNGTSFYAVGQAAEDNLQSGGSLEIVAGNYISDGTVVLKGNTTLFGHGDSTFIQQKAGIATHTSMFWISQSNVEIYNIWIDGNRANQFDNGDEMRQGIGAQGTTNLWIHNIKATNFTETGYDPAWCNNCTIENSILTGSGDGDIWFDIDSKNQVAYNNICNNIMAGDFGGLMSNIWINNNTANFIEIYQGSSGTPSNIMITNNRITANWKFAVYTQGCFNVTIKDNIITGDWYTTEAGLLISSGTNFTITGNTVTNFGYGIKSGTLLSGSQHLITLNDFRGNKIAVNDNISQTKDTVIYNIGADIASWDEIPK